MSTSVCVTGVAGFGPDGHGLDVRVGAVGDELLAASLTMRGLRPLARTARLAMVAAARLVAPGEDGGDRAAVVLGSAWACVDPLAEFVGVAAREGADRVFPMAFPNTVASVHAGYVATLLGRTGPVVSPCGRHAGLEAVVEAVSLLEHGRADDVLAVGAEARGPVVDAAAPGLGEGAAALLLSGDPEAALAAVTGCWTARDLESLPPQACEGVVRPVGEPVLGAATGALAVARAVRDVAAGDGPVTVVGGCGVQGVAAVRLEGPTRV